MRLVTLERGEVLTYKNDIFHVNVDSVAFLQECHVQQEGYLSQWYVSLDSAVSLFVTKSAFEKLKRAMESK